MMVEASNKSVQHHLHLHLSPTPLLTLTPLQPCPPSLSASLDGIHADVSASGLTMRTPLPPLSPTPNPPFTA